MKMKNVLACPNEQWGELAGELLAAGREVRLRLRGSSMYPLIHDQDIAYLRPINPARARCGAVVLYMVDKRPIVHRIVRRRRAGDALCFLICGDFNRHGHWVAADTVIGQGTCVERDGKMLSLSGWRGQWWGWAFSRLWRGASQLTHTGLSLNRYKKG